ncbi:MAG: ATP-binding cassette domain-containing protein [Cyanobacteria bacterium P01_D01_bin.73]
MAPAVLIKNLKKNYGSVQAVKDISFQVEPGELFGLLGPNGSGKSTTMRCLCTLMKPDAGTVEVSGFCAIAQPNQVRRRLGYVAQEVSPDKMLTGRELLELQGALYHMPSSLMGDRIEALTNQLDMKAWLDNKAGTYSGGMLRRIDLAAGLLHRPDVLVLDEPTVGLDIESRQAVWELLSDLPKQGTTVIMSSHYLEEVDALANRVAIIDRGKVIAEGSPNQLKEKIGGDRITLRIREFTSSDEAHQAKQLLMDQPWVQGAIINTAQGNSLNLVVDSSSDSLSQIQTILSAANLPIFGLSQSRPSLDDVYLAATGKTLNDAELAAVSTRDLKKEKKQTMRQ